MSLEQRQVDQVIQALETDQFDLAVALVKDVTGATERQAIDVVMTLLEGLEDADLRGLQF